MNPIILDVETTIDVNGNPFSERNKLCYVGIHHNNVSSLFDIEYSGNPYRDKLDSIQSMLNNDSILVGFNIKFDLHWIRKYGINFMDKRVWDCQLVHFILTGQQYPYPSLNSVAAYYDLGSKLDVIATEYWKNGVDTDKIPRDLLEDYLKQDLFLTQKVYEKQMEEFASSAKNMQRLISLHNQDLVILQEMEFNGLLFDENSSTILATELEDQIAVIDKILMEYHDLVEFNPNSTEHVSSLLYGGIIKVRRREAIGVFKTGERKGQTKERWVEHEITFPRLINPIKGSELTKEGFFSTDDQTLKSLKTRSKYAKDLVEVLLKRATLEKRLTAYYKGLVDLRKEMNWHEGRLHGQLNQCVARTGRLSSSKPNLQNFDGEIKTLFGSRYE